jgi:hypothetical protein
MANRPRSSKPQAWSYSALSSFELCPRKWAAESYYKTTPYEQNEQAKYGDSVHQQFAKFLTAAEPLPIDLRHHEPILEKLRNLPGTKLVEQQLAVTRTLDPTGFFDDNVWCRAIIDLAIHNGAKALIVDHKTGKKFPEFDQLDLMAGVIKVFEPEVEEVTAAFYWTKSKTFTKKAYGLYELSIIWDKFMPRVEKFQADVKAEAFPPKPNFLCKSYCRVKACGYCGEYGK